jgi:hypothetical protein
MKLLKQSLGEIFDQISALLQKQLELDEQIESSCCQSIWPGVGHFRHP